MTDIRQLILPLCTFERADKGLATARLGISGQAVHSFHGILGMEMGEEIANLPFELIDNTRHSK